MRLPAVLRPFANVIDEVSDERRSYGGNDGYWIYLATGWWSPEDETHCIHEDNPKACVPKLKAIERCPCCS